ncbi:hypothetical protein EVAR_19717_1 [Eumeta japonica]|uniref:Uncharacterized protein n=1 Tax=Eumeta variegata TaxID=151549 RepID=A0A4C1URS5_EUMVA|nr:hypothetical protein EVAR_19717_1 [Eumeta japonica]
MSELLYVPPLPPPRLLHFKLECRFLVFFPGRLRSPHCHYTRVNGYQRIIFYCNSLTFTMQSPLLLQVGQNRYGDRLQVKT